MEELMEMIGKLFGLFFKALLLAVAIQLILVITGSHYKIPFISELISAVGGSISSCTGGPKVGF